MRNVTLEDGHGGTRNVTLEGGHGGEEMLVKRGLPDSCRTKGLEGSLGAIFFCCVTQACDLEHVQSFDELI